MASEWPSLSLREAGVSLIDCEHRTPPASASGYPYIAIPQVREGRLDLGDVRLITHKDFLEWTRKARPQPNDVILSRRCNPGETAVVPPGLECALGQNLVLLRADGTKVWPPFLRWMVRGPGWWEQIGNFINAGAVFDSLKCADIPNFRLSIPPLSQQQAIAAILGSLDDKIELNRQTNETLEGMARAIFKSWFVDFDPVRAKAAGRQPSGMDTDTTALFPDRFEDSPLGEIPANWRVETIRERANQIQYGLTQSACSSPIGPSFLRITDIRGGSVDWATVPFCQVPPSDHEKYRIRDGDVFVARTGASTGENIRVVDPPDALFASYLVRFQFNEPAISRIVGEFMRTSAYFDYVAGSIGGSAQPNASAQVLAGAPMVFPTKDVAEQFYKLVEPLDRRGATNSRESGQLASIRDAMLPKLLSGEVRVPDAEKWIKEVV